MVVGGGERDRASDSERRRLDQAKQLSGFVTVTPNSIALLPILQVSHRTKRHLEFKKNIAIFFFMCLFIVVLQKKKKTYMCLFIIVP